MPDANAPKPPTVTPLAHVVAVKAAASSVPNISLPPETVRRWQEIVRQAISSGRDISLLVQQYAEQSFNTKLGSLDSQGARKRMLTRAHAAIERERERAEGHLHAQPSVKPPIMTRSFQPNTIEVPGPQDSPPAQAPVRNDKKSDIEWHHTTTQMVDPYTKRSELEAHVAKLVSQMTAIDQEVARIDAVLNKGLRNQQSVVNELAAVSRELYRLAQDVRGEPVERRTAVDGSGFQKSGGKKEVAASPRQGTTTSADVRSNPSLPPSGVISVSSDSTTPLKTVPINPLRPALKRLARMFNRATRYSGKIISAIFTPPITAAARSIAAAGHAIDASFSTIFAATSKSTVFLIEKIKDLWPWRGPPSG